MSIQFYCYPKCSTCAKARKFLEAHHIEVEEIHIKENPPKQSQLKEYHKKSDVKLKGMFNTSGESYRKYNLKENFDHMSQDAAYHLLSLDGMLIKRPILVLEDHVLFGFKEDQWKEKLNIT